VSVNDSSRNRHAKACPLGFRGKKRLENVLTHCRSQPRTIIRNANFDGRLALEVCVSARDLYQYRIIARGQRILKQVAKQLRQSKTIDQRLRIYIRKCFLKPGIATSTRHL
jgi:hypothetical protein